MEWWEERKDVLVREKARLDQKYPNNDFQFKIEEGYLWLKGSIQIVEGAECKFDFECRYPKSYPFAPPYIYPKDRKTHWVPWHQFILNGRFCLDIREHNWDSNFSAVEIIESMHTLINARVEKIEKKTDKLNVLEGVEPTLFEIKTEEIRCLYIINSNIFTEQIGIFDYFSFKEIGDNRIVITTKYNFADINEISLFLNSEFFNIWEFNIVSTKKGIYLKLNQSVVDNILMCKSNEDLYTLLSDRDIVEKEKFEAIIVENKSEYLLLVNEVLKPILIIKLSSEKSNISFYGCYGIDFGKLHERIPNKKEIMLLSKSKITIIGCGSGGSAIAEYLVKAGVGKFVLIDSEILEIENIYRHTCTLKDIGLKKTYALSHRLKTINPNVEIIVIDKRVEAFTDDIDSKIKDSDLIINAIGGSESVINAYSFSMKIPTIHCKVYPYGFGGEIFRIIPEITPCYDCLYRYLNKELEDVSIISDFPHNRTIDYNTTIEGETISMPSLAIDAGFIINIASKMAIEALLSKKEDLQSKPNIILWGNKKEWIFDEDYSCIKVQTQSSKSYHNCIVCNNHDAIQKEVNMDESAIEAYYATIQITK